MRLANLVMKLTLALLLCSTLGFAPCQCRVATKLECYPGCQPGIQWDVCLVTGPYTVLSGAQPACQIVKRTYENTFTDEVCDLYGCPNKKSYARKNDNYCKNVESPSSCENEYTVSKENSCPNTNSYNGYRCYAIKDCWDGACHCRGVCGWWDGSDKKCVTCNDDHTENKVCGDTSGVYISFESGCSGQYCDKNGDGKCESACGASSECDERSPNTCGANRKWCDSTCQALDPPEYGDESEDKCECATGSTANWKCDYNTHDMCDSDGGSEFFYDYVLDTSDPALDYNLPCCGNDQYNGDEEWWIVKDVVFVENGACCNGTWHSGWQCCPAKNEPGGNPACLKLIEAEKIDANRKWCNSNGQCVDADEDRQVCESFNWVWRSGDYEFPEEAEAKGYCCGDDGEEDNWGVSWTTPGYCSGSNTFNCDQYDDDESACKDSPCCRWAGECSGTNQHDCSQYDSYSSCNSDPCCHWFCIQYPWGGGECACARRSCSDLGSSACQQCEGCSWSGDCKRKSCDSLGESACEQCGCTWNPEKVEKAVCCWNETAHRAQYHYVGETTNKVCCTTENCRQQSAVCGEDTGYPHRYADCQSYTCSKCGPCGSRRDCEPGYCCEAEAVDIDNDGKYECFKAGAYGKWLCKTASPGVWIECNSLNVGREEIFDGKVYRCEYAYDTYAWVMVREIEERAKSPFDLFSNIFNIFIGVFKTTGNFIASFFGQ